LRYRETQSSIVKRCETVAKTRRQNHAKSFSAQLPQTQKTKKIVINLTQIKMRNSKISTTSSSLLKVKPIEKTPPYVTAQSWIVYDAKSKIVLAQKFASMKREIASLTKIMVFYACLQLCKEL
jgi:D-alanyl-D-alanine carboxypeptidase